MVLMIPIEELKLSIVLCGIVMLQSVLMIPIEELKPAMPYRSWSTEARFDDTYWGIETTPLSIRKFSILMFWWYLLRNWNPGAPSLPLLPLRFWWYLLRNWNLVPGPSDPRCGLVLMIPIEELKHRWAMYIYIDIFRFDDTYWGIETILPDTA